MVFLLLLIPIIAAGLFLLIKEERSRHIISLTASSLLLLCGMLLTH